MKKNVFSTVLAATSIAVGLSACSTHSIHVPGVGSVKYSNNGSNVTISSHGNTLAEGTSLPANFPSTVPLPKGYRVLGVMNGNNAATGSSAASAYFDLYLAVSNTSQAAAATSYEAQLQSSGFTIDNQGGSGSGLSMTVISAKSAQWGVNAVFGNSGGYASQLKSGEIGVNLIVSNGS